jgi:hypothetical protein
MAPGDVGTATAELTERLSLCLLTKTESGDSFDDKALFGADFAISETGVSPPAPAAVEYSSTSGNSEGGCEGDGGKLVCCSPGMSADADVRIDAPAVSSPKILFPKMYSAVDV